MSQGNPSLPHPLGPCLAHLRRSGNIWGMNAKQRWCLSLSSALSHRKMVDKEKSKQPRRMLEFNGCAQCLNSISLVNRSLPRSVNGHRVG